MNNKFDKRIIEQQENSTLITPEQKEAKRLRKKYHEYLLSTSSDTTMRHKIDLNLIYPETMDKQELIIQVDDLKKCLDSFRPLSSIQAQNLEEVFNIEYTYDSNRIEGNTMTLSETALVLQKGVTIDGRTLQEHLEIVNHRDALDYVKDIVHGQEELNKRVLLDIHSLVLQGIKRNDAGKFRQENVTIGGSVHTPPDFLQVPNYIDKYFEFYEKNKDSLHPVILSADMHEKLVTIHPFVDGNGRTSRLVMNMLLMKHGYPIAIISGDRKQRHEYYDSLENVRVNRQENKFHVLILQEVKKSLFRYLDVVSMNGREEEEGKGFYFFQKIKPFIDN